MADHPSNKVTRETLASLFVYHPPRPGQQIEYMKIREAAHRLAALIFDSAPDCADRTSAIRKIREAVMMANAAIALAPHSPAPVPTDLKGGTTK